MLGGVLRKPRNMHLARVDVDEEKHMEGLGPEHGPYSLGKEVAGPEGFEVALDKLIPSILCALVSREDAVLAQDVLDRVTRKHLDAQLL